MVLPGYLAAAILAPNDPDAIAPSSSNSRVKISLRISGGRLMRPIGDSVAVVLMVDISGLLAEVVSTA